MCTRATISGQIYAKTVIFLAFSARDIYDSGTNQTEMPSQLGMAAAGNRLADILTPKEAAFHCHRSPRTPFQPEKEKSFYLKTSRKTHTASFGVVYMYVYF